MAPLPVDLRNQLARAIQEARREGEAGARQALRSLAVHLSRAHDSMDADPDGRALRGRLRAHGKQLGDLRDLAGAQEIDRLAHEVAYEHWHRMLFARFLAENGLLIEPANRVAISIEECEELAREQGANPWALAASYAQAMLPKIFRVDDPVLDVQLPPETRLALERILQTLPSIVFTADDSLGWTYQFWQTEKKDEVNQSGVKIGADELPAVTQLFTEHYMVLFLFHNTIGAWRAGKILAANPELARNARDEEELRRAVRLPALGGYDFSYLRFVRERIEGDTDDVPSGSWRPAAGTFDGWPTRASELRVLDPCCGSGHFLVEAFGLLVRLRMAEEAISDETAVSSVVTDNLFGLEIDARCTQIAAFNLALAGWKLLGRPIEPASINVACSGLAVGSTRDEWMSVLEQGVDPQIRFFFGELHALFSKAPTLGSLIDPKLLAAGRLDAQGTGRLLHSFSKAVSSDAPERHELGVAAQGLARAADWLGRRYTLVITNVPYLGRGNQSAALKTHVESHFPLGKADLATAFVLRCIAFCEKGGTAALVTPQNWLFLTTYKRLRETSLRMNQWNMVAKLGPGAFETISGEVVNVALVIVSAEAPGDEADLTGVDVASPRGQVQSRPAEKAAKLRESANCVAVSQRSQLEGPDSRISFVADAGREHLEQYAICRLGLGTGDAPHYVRSFWEVPGPGAYWSLFQTATTGAETLGGFDSVLAWDPHAQRVRGMSDAERQQAHNQDYRGREAWGRAGVAVSIVSELKASAYLGSLFDKSVAAIVPLEAANLSAVTAFLRSREFSTEVRRLDQKLMVTNATLLKVPFSLERWRGVAATEYPGGLPAPETNSPSLWLFHGQPAESTDPLQVATARLCGFRWPAEVSEINLSVRAAGLVRRCGELLGLAAEDGIVCIPSVGGRKPAADRLLALLSACGIRPDRDLDEWLRNAFFEEHCKLFGHRPFIWHIWDGRPDGFQALVNYHKLAGGNGSGRRILESLTYSYLGDWIERQRADQRDGKDGADARLAAAQNLQALLGQILSGEPPCDLFVRWKSLQDQPIGWTPDINDGVRLNIRPFMSAELHKGGRAGAGILRWKPNVSWRKDRGTEPNSVRSIKEFPWFWGCPGDGTRDERTDFRGGVAFDGCRWNDLHYSVAAKQAALQRRDAAGAR